ncbi:MAG: hypothetical protein HQ559_17575 [Lentisphaerae bacterium]|nr:hypothetical protein [Lentisphaerota bacterium]
MKKREPFDFWYAVNNTEILLMPSAYLETFDATVLNYHLVCELMDSVGQTRVREGRIQASRPQIITPEAYSQTILEGFGDEARHYIDWLKEHEKEVRGTPIRIPAAQRSVQRARDLRERKDRRRESGKGSARKRRPAERGADRRGRAVGRVSRKTVLGSDTPFRGEECA